MVHPNELLFREGLEIIFNLWESLKLAIRNEWGGPDSKEKRDWMLDIIVAEFRTKGKRIEVFDIEDILTQIMSDEFETILEDDSAYIVSKDIFKLYGQIVKSDLSFLTRLREIQQIRGNSSANILPNSMEDGQDSTDEEDDDEEGM
ncbi:hypothetical protein K502DRAFT_299272 [Neoconidiobolus thromboides FSU 785]|nr:hypothetical protein K502DRAFT_299272 [Neoconidiobolus thromboides FSU 785]